MLTAQEYTTLRAKLNRLENWLGSRPYRTEDIPAGLEDVSNADRSAMEVYDFAHNIPATYFLYIKRNPAPYPGGRSLKGIATTWTGDKLGDVIFGTSFRSNFGDRRVSIRVRGINGRWYVGTYFESAGDYARVRLATQQPTVEA